MSKRSQRSKKFGKIILETYIMDIEKKQNKNYLKNVNVEMKMKIIY